MILSEGQRRRHSRIMSLRIMVFALGGRAMEGSRLLSARNNDLPFGIGQIAFLSL